jgi:hypothetical protein
MDPWVLKKQQYLIFCCFFLPLVLRLSDQYFSICPKGLHGGIFICWFIFPKTWFYLHCSPSQYIGLVRIASRCSISLILWRFLRHNPTCFIPLQPIASLERGIQQMVLHSNSPVRMNPQSGQCGWLESCMYSPGYLWNSPLSSCSRHVSFTLTQPPRTPQRSRNTWIPNGISYLGLCIELHGCHSVLCLLGSCLPVLLRESRLGYESPVQECQMHDNSEVLQWDGGVHLPWRKGFWAALRDGRWGCPSNAPNC